MGSSETHHWSFCAPSAPETLFPLRQGGASLHTGTSKIPLPDKSFCTWDPQKLHYWSFCALSAPETSFLIKPWWSIAPHENLKNSTTSGFSALGILRNSVSGVFAHPVRQKSCYLQGMVEHGTSKTPLPEFLCTGSSETPILEFRRIRCTRNLVLYEARWSIAAHGILKSSTSGVSANGILSNSSSYEVITLLLIII